MGSWQAGTCHTHPGPRYEKQVSDQTYNQDGMLSNMLNDETDRHSDLLAAWMGIVLTYTGSTLRPGLPSHPYQGVSACKDPHAEDSPSFKGRSK